MIEARGLPSHKELVSRSRARDDETRVMDLLVPHERRSKRQAIRTWWHSLLHNSLSPPLTLLDSSRQRQQPISISPACQVYRTIASP
jgi:hypothetical protein